MKNFLESPEPHPTANRDSHLEEQLQHAQQKLQLKEKEVWTKKLTHFQNSKHRRVKANLFWEDDFSKITFQMRCKRMELNIVCSCSVRNCRLSCIRWSRSVSPARPGCRSAEKNFDSSATAAAPQWVECLWTTFPCAFAKISQKN